MSDPIDDARQMARRVAERVIARDAVFGNYTLNLSLEAMLEMDRATGEREYTDHVLSVLRRRGCEPGVPIPYEMQPFVHLEYKLLQLTRDERYASPFVAETDRWWREAPRSEEGAVAHAVGEPGRYLLIDMIQDYCSRMAQAGELTGVASYFAECAQQFRLYHKLLRYSESGLYSTSRGWQDDPVELAPGAWARGHGWLIRGMTDSLSSMPREYEHYQQVQGYLRELADALLAVQQQDGMWHALVHLPPEDSHPDSTGTGLICYALFRAAHEGILEAMKYEDAALRGYQALRGCVTPEGLVMHESKSCHESIEGCYRKQGATNDGTGHGPGCAIFACAGRVIHEK